MQLDTVARMLSENDLLVRAVLPLDGRATWDVVHALRFRGWLCENLGIPMPDDLRMRVDSIATETFTSPRYAQIHLAVADLLTLSAEIAAATALSSTIDWSVSRPYFKPNHRHLGDWALFMLAHDAWHLGRASTHR